MSEFEETGSEGTEVGKDEQECAKRDRGGSEEEKDNKDSREEEGEQMSDSQQNQVETVKNAVTEVADRDEMGPGEVDDGKEESEKSEAADKGETGIDKNTQSKVLLSDSLDEEEDEQHQKATENTKEANESVVTKVTVQKDLTSKADDLTPQVPVEDKHPKISVNDKKGDAEKDSFISVHVKEPVHETHKSDKTQELSSTVQVQDEVHTLASEKAQKPTDFKAETKTVSVDAEKAQVTSATPKSEEKEHSHTEPKEEAKSEAAKSGDKETITIQDAGHDGNKSQVKEPSLKSNEKSIPEVKDQMSNSEDKTETEARTVLPKEKTMDSAEVNQFPQGAPGNSQAHKSETEDSKKINYPQGKPLKEESSKSDK